MVVRTAQGGGSRAKVFELRSGAMAGELARDNAKALKLYPIEMEGVRESATPIVVYTALLSLLTTTCISLGVLMKTGSFVLQKTLGLLFGSFLTMLMFFFAAGYIYKGVLGKRLDTSYLSYVYVVAFSMTYYPLAMFLAIMIGGPMMFILTIVLSSVSQFFISTSMTRDHRFESNREGFIFSMVSFVLQWGFVICSTSLFFWLLSSE